MKRILRLTSVSRRSSRFITAERSRVRAIRVSMFGKFAEDAGECDLIEVKAHLLGRSVRIEVDNSGI